MLGTLEVGDDSSRAMAPRGRTSTLLAVLLLRFGRPVQSETLIPMLWPIAAPQSANANLRQYVSRVRNFITSSSPAGQSCLRSTPGGYVLEVPRHELDLAAFEDLTNQGRRMLSDGRPDEAKVILQRAVRLWRGHLCQGAVLGPELEMEMTYWEELRLRAQILLLQARLRLGEDLELIAEARPLAEAHPLCEELCGLLMLALYRCRRRAEALQAFELARTSILENLGVEPMEDLRLLENSIRLERRLVTNAGWLDSATPITVG